MEAYTVKKLTKRELSVNVPASKSILNRALLLAAFTEGETLLSGVHTYGKDAEELIACLKALGAEIGQTEQGLTVRGGELHRSASLNVGSGGTSARFLTAMLAFRGGKYALSASKQMSRRPMDILSALREGGVRFRFPERQNSFPFLMQSDGAPAELTVDTDVSTQFASGLLLAAAVGKSPFTLHLTGRRTEGSYIATTLEVIRAFGARAVRSGNDVTVSPTEGGTPRFAVPPDVSGACYFYALSLLCGAKVLVRDVHPDCGQADLRFLDLLSARGVKVTDTPEGVLADGSGVETFEGFDLDLSDFSDQTLTLAAMAPFATTPTVLRGVGHIRRQECDRMEAIAFNLRSLGVPCKCGEGDIFIRPAPVRPAEIETFADHRVAMAFTLVGLKAGNVTIKDPGCCRKTFGNYFAIVDGLTS